MVEIAIRRGLEAAPPQELARHHRALAQNRKTAEQKGVAAAAERPEVWMAQRKRENQLRARGHHLLQADDVGLRLAQERDGLADLPVAIENVGGDDADAQAGV